MLGIDPLADLLDRITMLGVYYVPGRPSSPKGFPGAVVAVLTVDKPAVVRNSINKVHAAAAGIGDMAFSKLDVAGENVIFGPPSNPQMRFADAMVGDKVIVVVSGQTKARVANAIQVVKGKANVWGRTRSAWLPGTRRKAFGRDLLRRSQWDLPHFRKRTDAEGPPHDDGYREQSRLVRGDRPLLGNQLWRHGGGAVQEVKVMVKLWYHLM